LLLFYALLFISILIPILSIIVVFCILFKLFSIDNDIIISLAGLNIFAFFLITFSIYIIIKNKKNISKTKDVLLDAEETIATARRVDIENLKYKPYQIEINFKLNGVYYKKISPPGNAIIGYNKYLLKYCKNKFRILYSKKYDEIIFLK